jgi:hypothetical protein
VWTEWSIFIMIMRQQMSDARGWTSVIVAVGLWAVPVTGFAQDGLPDGGAGRNGPVPTFSRDVAPILYSKCIACHRPGEVAPMSLRTFDEVRPWARAIRERVMSREMPPWHADPQVGEFRNDRSLTPGQIDTIVRWVDAGAPQGDPRATRPLPDLVEGWQIGTPDVVFEMPVDYRVPATGTIDYQYFEVPTRFTEDRWVQAGEVRAGNREHVHHIIVSVVEPGENTRPTVVAVKPVFADGEAPPPRSRTAAERARLAQSIRSARAITLVNWAVGEDAPVYPAGLAKRIPAGSTLLFQVHYTTDGTPATDRSKIGLIFAKEPPRQEIRTGAIANLQFAIPAGSSSHQVEAEATFADDVKVWTMHPHMHLRGKAMTYTAIYPDGRREVVLNVPKYDFGWQTDYWLVRPLSLPKGSKLHVTAQFDNSAANRFNPDPSATVRWGDQTWEEMMIGYFTYTVESGRPAAGEEP